MNALDTPPATTSIDEVLRDAAAALAGRSESPRLDAEVLLAKVLKLTRAGLITHNGQPLKPNEQTAFDALIHRRMQGTPVAYLTGRREFWSLDLHVSPAVLVPRPETELLVEQVLLLAPNDPPRSLLDLGTGSGAIALAIAAERPAWPITAVDLSSDALEVATRNGRDSKITHIRWQVGSWFDALPNERFDFIISNPPYVASDDPALAELTSEPRLALTSGPTGLEAHQTIIAQAPAHLEAGGWLLLEHGQDQAPAVRQLLQQQNFDSIRTCLDFSGKPRVTLGTLHKPLGIL
jgi:release factor glutamine methyltransferase